MNTDSPERFYIRPVGLLGGAAARAVIRDGQARFLAGGPFVFTYCEIIQRGGVFGNGKSHFLPLSDVSIWSQKAGLAKEMERLLDDISRPRLPLAGLPITGQSAHRPLIMGVVNVTPDSFSDGGDHESPQAAIQYGKKLLAAGADLLDIGGESTRPGAEPVSQEEELRRVLPVLQGLAGKGVVLSIDTRKAAVMEQALVAGASIINDVSALGDDPDSLGVALKSGAPVILMHKQGEPQNMQDDPEYDHALLDVYDELQQRVTFCQNAGISRDRIMIDPGVGFGKTLIHNAEILAGLSLFHGLGCGLLVGVSRKRFVAGLSRGEAPKQRLPGSLAAGLGAVRQGAHVLRVHDVAQTRQALSVWDTFSEAA